MGEARSSLLTVEPFAALFVLSSLHFAPPDPSRRPGIAQPQYSTVQAACPFMVTLPVPRWRVGLTLKEAVLLIILWPTDTGTRLHPHRQWGSYNKSTSIGLPLGFEKNYCYRNCTVFSLIHIDYLLYYQDYILL